jgi:hypothetical protein
MDLELRCAIGLLHMDVARGGNIEGIRFKLKGFIATQDSLRHLSRGEIRCAYRNHIYSYIQGH